MITVKTLNSTYEIDEELQLARRVVGVNDPTPRFGLGGDATWRQYLRIEHLAVGGSLVIAWPPAGDEDHLGVELKSHTVTSQVLSITR